MTGAIPALSHRLRPLLAAICLGAASAADWRRRRLRARPRRHRRRCREGDRRGRQHLDLADRRGQGRSRRAAGRDAAIAAGLAVRGILRRFLQEPPRRPGRQGRRLQPHKTNSLGSGFIIDTSGIVVTNNHVIADADEINVIMNDGTKIKAELVGVDKKTDLAVLKFKPDKPLTAVKFGDSDKLRLGEWVIAIGNPFSLGGTVTAGIVSARNRDINSGSLRQLHPDRRRDQPRQFRRTAVQPRWRSDRRQHADHLADRRLDRHRLCGALEDGGRRGRPAAAVRRACAAAGSASASSRSPTRSPKASTSSRRAAR